MGTVKIAHVMTRFSPDEHPGGVERVVDELATRQAEEHNVEIICRNQFGDEPEEQRNSYRVKRADVKDTSGLRTLTSFPSMRKLIKNSNADLFHIHDWSPYLNYLMAGSPASDVLTLHNLSDRIGGLLQRFCARKASTCTCVSSWLAKHIGAATEVVPNGTEINSYENREPDSYVLFVGSLTIRKGIEELCSAADKSGMELTIVGTGELEDRLQQQYDHTFLGRVSEERLQDLYAQSNAVAMPSRKEGFGLVWIEALAAGKPVMYTETGIGADLPSYCGVGLPTDYTTDQLSTALEELTDTGYDSSRIQEYAERFKWGAIQENYMRLYDEVLAS